MSSDLGVYFPNVFGPPLRQLIDTNAQRLRADQSQSNSTRLHYCRSARAASAGNARTTATRTENTEHKRDREDSESQWRREQRRGQQLIQCVVVEDLFKLIKHSFYLLYKRLIQFRLRSGLWSLVWRLHWILNHQLFEATYPHLQSKGSGIRYWLWKHLREYLAFI